MRRKLVFANRLHGEDVRYYNPYQKKKLGILEGKKNFYKDGYFSDVVYLIKTTKPKIKGEFKEESPDMKKFIKEVNDSVKGPAEIIAELYDADNSLQEDEDIVMVHVRSKDKSIEAFFNIKYIDSILTMYPTADIFIKDNDFPLLFKLGKVPVACVMAIRQPELSDYIIKRMEKNK